MISHKHRQLNLQQSPEGARLSRSGALQPFLTGPRWCRVVRDPFGESGEYPPGFVGERRHADKFRGQEAGQGPCLVAVPAELRRSERL